MKKMVITICVCVSLFLGGCVNSDDKGYLPMPEKIIGFWNGHSKSTAYLGLQINENGTMYSMYDPETVDPRQRYWYKVFRIEEKEGEDGMIDTYVYTLIKDQYSAIELDKEDGITPEIRERILEPKWYYIRFIHDVEDDTSRIMLETSYWYCGSLKQSAEESADIHWERLQSGECGDKMGNNYYARY